MKFPSGLFAQQAVGKGGVKLEADGEIILPPVLQPIVEISHPFFKANQSNTGVNSWGGVVTSFTTGVDGAVVANAGTLVSGIWSLALVYAWKFTGTTDITKSFTLKLIDADGADASMVVLPFFSGAEFSNSLNFWLALTSSFVIQMTISARILGDTSFGNCSVLAKKII